MKIVDFKIDTIKASLKKPFVTNIRKVTHIEDILLYLICDDGSYGYGEAPPTVAITCEDLDSIKSAISKYIFPAICGVDIFDDVIFERLGSSLPKNTSAKACVDMAIFDLRAKKSNMPLYEYLGGTSKSIQTNLTISLNDCEIMLKDSILAWRDGFEVLKIKVGQDSFKTIETVRLIRESLPDAIIRIDANQAWEAKQAVEIIDKISKWNIELVEQPVLASDLPGLAYVSAHSAVPILADESVFCIDDARKILDGKMAHYINIKLMKTGGIFNANKIVNLCKNHNARIMMGSMLESVVSISAALHFAMSDKIICFYDLDGPLLSEPSRHKNSMIIDGDILSLQPSFGLGLD